MHSLQSKRARTYAGSGSGVRSRIESWDQKFHAHIVAGHTSNNINIIEYLQHRGLHELEAEGSAYILMNELGIAEPDELAESRTYIRHWIGDREVPEANIRRIFTTADSILRAGRLATSC